MKKLDELKKKLNSDVISVRDGVVTVRKQYNKNTDETAKKFKQQVKTRLRKLKIKHTDEEFGAVNKPKSVHHAIRRQSHTFYKFRIK